MQTLTCLWPYYHPLYLHSYYNVHIVTHTATYILFLTYNYVRIFTFIFLHIYYNICDAYYHILPNTYYYVPVTYAHITYILLPAHTITYIWQVHIFTHILLHTYYYTLLNPCIYDMYTITLGLLPTHYYLHSNIYISFRIYCHICNIT